MEPKQLTRRTFLRTAAMTAVGMLAASCAQPTPQVIEKPVTVQVEKQVAVEKQVINTVVVEKQVTVQVEKQVEKVVTATPISSTHESPILAKQVAAGQLPPLKDRLPAEPLVVPVLNSIGKFGGTWQAAWLGMDYPWDSYQTGSETLVRYTPDAGTVQPNLIKEWTASADGKVYTITLRKGIKWSDGEPFNADDLMFYFTDVVGNKDLTPVYPRSLTTAGTPGKIEKVDDYTIKFTFAAGYGLFMYGAMPLELYEPKHYMQQFHPTYTKPETLAILAKNAKYDSWFLLFQARSQAGFYWLTNPDHPTLAAWRCTVPAPSTRVKWERNAYYWKTDKEGNQLPYIDAIVWDLVQDSQALSLKAMSGELDFVGWWLSTGDYTLYMENRTKGDFQVFPWADTYGANPAVFPNQTVKDPALRKIFNDVRFRQALSLGMNRAEINKLAYMNMGVPRQASLVKQSAQYSEAWEKNFSEYDAAKANKLLDDMGLSKKNSEGIRLREDGQPLAFTIEFASIFDNYPDVMELVVEQWQKLGLKIALKNLQRALFVPRRDANEMDVWVWTEPGLTILYNNWWFFNNTGGSWGPPWNEWYQSNGQKGEKPPDDVVRLYKIWDELQLTPDEAQRKKLIDESIGLHVKNVWIIGIVGSLPRVIIVKNRLKNVPEKTIYDNTLGCPLIALPEQFYIEQK